MPRSKDRFLPARRRLLQGAGALALLASPLRGMSADGTSEGISFAAGPRPLDRYPGKREMILVHSRPPHLENALQRLQRRRHHRQRCFSMPPMTGLNPAEADALAAFVLKQ